MKIGLVLESWLAAVGYWLLVVSVLPFCRLRKNGFFVQTTPQGTSAFARVTITVEVSCWLLAVGAYLQSLTPYLLPSKRLTTYNLELPRNYLCMKTSSCYLLLLSSF